LIELAVAGGVVSRFGRFMMTATISQASEAALGLETH
jgi:hypothetical protein